VPFSFGVGLTKAGLGVRPSADGLSKQQLNTRIKNAPDHKRVTSSVVLPD